MIHQLEAKLKQLKQSNASLRKELAQCNAEPINQLSSCNPEFMVWKTRLLEVISGVYKWNSTDCRKVLIT
jgi:hypothetical protein